MYIRFFLTLFTFLVIKTFSQQQDTTYIEENLKINKFIDGTLLIPKPNKTSALAIIIAGSGPTDRDGNQNFLKNNSLKKLAVGLTNEGISTFRFDKRTVKQIRTGKMDSEISFDDFVTDVDDIITYFKTIREFDEIFLIGHSQGSLVGMLAANEYVDGFISLSGAGKSMDSVIIDQIVQTAPMYKEDAERVFAILKEGNTTSDYPMQLSSIFNEGIQPFMSSWIKYNPSEIISRLEIPTLIINGTKDLQVSIEEAKLLEASAKESKLVLIENMNHVLFTIEGDELENSKSYSETYRKINPELIKSISSFIKS